MIKRLLKASAFGMALTVTLMLSGCDASGALRDFLESGAAIESRTEGTKEPSAEKSTSEVEEVRLIRVVDGDTLLVDLGGTETYVRLIGVNTPESVASDEYLEKTGKQNTEEGKAASEFVRNLLSGTEKVWLEYDEERMDQYERTLAYVWLDNDRTEILNMLNARLLAEGYAEPMTIKPNVMHAEELAALVNDGR